VQEWNIIDPEEIRAEHPQIFDSQDPSTREEINDIAALPLETDAGEEVRIYSPDGNQIMRREPLFEDADPPPCAPLVNLRTIQQFFESSSESLLLDHDKDSDSNSIYPPPSQEDAHCSLYPQAYLKVFGQVQANGVPPAFRAIVKEINSSVGRTEVYESDFEDEHDDSTQQEHAIRLDPLISDSCQIYNAVAHKLMAQAGTLDAVQGDITAALAGSYAESQKDRLVAQHAFNVCEANLPHRRVEHRLSTEHVRKSLRLENVYVLKLQDLSDKWRNGRCDFHTLPNSGWQILMGANFQKHP